MIETGRHYDIPGEGKMWSVTTILSILEKPALVQWAANCAADYIKDELDRAWDTGKFDTPYDEICLLAKRAHTQKKDEAADIGTVVHDRIEYWVETCTKPEVSYYYNPATEIDEKVAQGVKSFLSWAESVSLRPILSEVRVHSRRHLYAGRFDMLATMKQGKQRKPRTYLIDVKTSNGIYDTMLYQLAAYAEAFAETDGRYQIDGIGIIRLDKETGRAEWKEYTRIEWIHGWEIFHRLVEVYRLIKGNPK